MCFREKASLVEFPTWRHTQIAWWSRPLLLDELTSQRQQPFFRGEPVEIYLSNQQNDISLNSVIFVTGEGSDGPGGPHNAPTKSERPIGRHISRGRRWPDGSQTLQRAEWPAAHLFCRRLESVMRRIEFARTCSNRQSQNHKTGTRSVTYLGLSHTPGLGARPVRMLLCVLILPCACRGTGGLRPGQAANMPLL